MRDDSPGNKGGTDTAKRQVGGRSIAQQLGAQTGQPKEYCGSAREGESSAQGQSWKRGIKVEWRCVASRLGEYSPGRTTSGIEERETEGGDEPRCAASRSGESQARARRGRWRAVGGDESRRRVAGEGERRETEGGDERRCAASESGEEQARARRERTMVG